MLPQLYVVVLEDNSSFIVQSGVYQNQLIEHVTTTLGGRIGR